MADFLRLFCGTTDDKHADQITRCSSKLLSRAPLHFNKQSENAWLTTFQACLLEAFFCESTHASHVYQISRCEVKLGNWELDFSFEIKISIEATRPKAKCQTCRVFSGQASWDFFVGLLMLNMSSTFHVAKSSLVWGLNFSLKNPVGCNWAKNVCFHSKMETSCTCPDVFLWISPCQTLNFFSNPEFVYNSKRRSSIKIHPTWQP